MLLTDFTSFLGAAAGSPPLEISVIILGTFILEDAATLLAAMQVAAGGVSLPLALASLYAGSSWAILAFMGWGGYRPITDGRNAWCRSGGAISAING